MDWNALHFSESRSPNQNGNTNHAQLCNGRPFANSMNVNNHLLQPHFADKPQSHNLQKWKEYRQFAKLGIQDFPHTGLLGDYQRLSPPDMPASRWCSIYATQVYISCADATTHAIPQGCFSPGIYLDYSNHPTSSISARILSG